MAISGHAGVPAAEQQSDLQQGQNRIYLPVFLSSALEQPVLLDGASWSSQYAPITSPGPRDEAGAADEGNRPGARHVAWRGAFRAPKPPWA